MLFKEENHTKPINKKKAVLLILKADGAYRYHREFKRVN
jgi:hypothetical protein